MGKWITVVVADSPEDLEWKELEKLKPETAQKSRSWASWFSVSWPLS